MDIRALFAPQNSCLQVNFGFLRQVEDTVSDFLFIESLFKEEDVKYYYVLSKEHSQNIRLFHQYLSGNKLCYIYENKQHIPMGIFTCELRQTNNDEINGFVSYALLPQFRGHGYTENALKTFCMICRDSQLSYIVLDICMSNEASIRIANKSGFIDKNANGLKVGYIDPEHFEMGIRTHWFYSLHEKISEREQLCRQAMQAYKNNDYKNCIELFNQALNHKCPTSCPFTDVQIYANLAMAYSSIDDYIKDYQYLMKAYNGGVRNDSVMKELNWLKNNVPWACK